MAMKKKPTPKDDASRDLYQVPIGQFPVSQRVTSSKFYLPAELAAELDVGIDCLWRWRTTGEGPPVCQLSARKFVYLKDDVERWLTDRRRTRVRPKPRRKNGADFKSSRG